MILAKKQQYLKDRYVETMLGRIRRFETPTGSAEQAELQREAFSTFIQGSAADLMKKAMVNVWKELKLNKKNARILLQLHDELLLNVPDDELESVCFIVKNQMEKVITLHTRLPVKIKIGQNWGELVEN